VSDKHLVRAVGVGYEEEDVEENLAMNSAELNDDDPDVAALCLTSLQFPIVQQQQEQQLPQQADQQATEERHQKAKPGLKVAVLEEEEEGDVTIEEVEFNNRLSMLYTQLLVPRKRFCEHLCLCLFLFCFFFHVFCFSCSTRLPAVEREEEEITKPIVQTVCNKT
jgi:hypothetical protein